ncbi:MAG: DNA methyltransferase [Chloroflexota bacterium]|nr:DNA methyltransferase [Chloroflexota bacterium]
MVERHIATVPQTAPTERIAAPPHHPVPPPPIPFGPYELVLDDAFDWLGRASENSIHGVVTDPPYGLMEYDPDQLEKRDSGHGGVWRVPPALNGYIRSPLPRFTVLDDADKARLEQFFGKLGRALCRVLVPGGHVFVATNPILSHYVYRPLIEAGFEKRGEVIRLVSTLRGGDRPKNAHDEFPNVTVMPKSCWEPWGIFRKPIEGRVQDNLRKWKTGGLRRKSEDEPFRDLIESGIAPKREREIAPHPSLKPQDFLRQLTLAVLPLGEGTILDPFMGSGSTIAAASACGLRSVGIESNQDFFRMAEQAVPRLRLLYLDKTKTNVEST